MQNTMNSAKQANTRSFKTLFIAILAIYFFAATKSEASDLKDWAASTHLGYSVNQRSTTGFKNVAGSLLFLDLSHEVNPEFHFGMRTIAQGGEENNNEYYRMGVGPLVSYNFYKNWRAQASVTFFNETANDSSKEAAYKSKGRTYQIGWERYRTLMKNVELSWGGFYMIHQGNVTVSSRTGTSTAASTRFANISTNQGASRGIEMALRFSL